MNETRKVQWERMLKHELDAAVAAFPAAYLSYGLCEPHGLYNPLGLDELKAYGICLRAAREGGGIVAPPSYWHIHEDNPGSRNFLRENVTVRPMYLTSIPGELFYRMYFYQLRACVNAGFRAIIAMTGHYGGLEIWMKAYAKLFQKYVAPVPIWALADWEVLNYRDEHGEYKGGHSGVCETSQLMGVCPDLPNLKLDGLPEDDPFAGGGWKLAEVRRRVTPELAEHLVQSQARNLANGARQMVAEGPKAALPFIPIEDMPAHCERILREGPKGAWLMSESETEEFRATTMRPILNYCRASNGALPRSAFPGGEIER